MSKVVEMAANGRLVIPAETRAALGLSQSAGSFQVEVRDGAVVLTPVTTVAVPVDFVFPITPVLVESVRRAEDEGDGLSRAEVVAVLAAHRLRVGPSDGPGPTRQ